MSVDLHDLHDGPAEEAALAAALTNEAACEYVVSNLQPSDLWQENSRRVLRAVATLHAAGRPVDTVTVRPAVCSGASEEDVQRLSDYVGHLGSTFTVAGNVAEYVASIVGFTAKRRVLLAADEVREAALSANGNVSELPAALEVITADALADVRQRGIGRDAAAAVGDRSVFIDWTTFWSEEEQPEWAYPGILARGRGHAIWALHKAGKSLLTLFLAARIAVEEGHHVVYLDYEMTAQDVRERLADMDYGADTDLSRLHYYLLPSLPPLDRVDGGDALMSILDALAADASGAHFVVIVDTISRAVAGEEDKSDTWRNFYINTGMRLKQRGVTWLRLDHSGWDGEHARGSSGKGDDVDVTWQLKPTENGVTLKCKAARMSWIPQSVTLVREEFPLRFVPAAGDWPVGTAEVANLLDRLAVPLDASVRTAGSKLREVDEGRRHEVVSAALKWRREKAADQFRYRGEQRGEHPSAFPTETECGSTGEQASISLGNSAGNTGEQASGHSGERTPPLKGGTAPQSRPGDSLHTSGTGDGFDF